MIVLHHILQYIILLNCIIVDCFILLYHIIYLVLFLFSSFYFHFRPSVSFTFTFQILFNIVLHSLFYLVFVYYIDYHVHYQSSPRSLEPKKWNKNKQFHFFTHRHLGKNVYFFTLILLMGMFLIFLIAV